MELSDSNQLAGSADSDSADPQGEPTYTNPDSSSPDCRFDISDTCYHPLHDSLTNVILIPDRNHNATPKGEGHDIHGVHHHQLQHPPRYHYYPVSGYQLADSPPPFNVQAHVPLADHTLVHTPDDGVILPLFMDQRSDDFWVVGGDTVLSSQVHYLVIKSDTPRTITLPILRGHQRSIIHISAVTEGTGDQGAGIAAVTSHVLKPGRAWERIQEQDSYLVDRSITVVSHKGRWYVF